ncbi:BamA/TamA family outer membrane protein, partial [Candidatus Poribacteria bacterium]|nr:BamA/TamA family outer membrane protein [Candidatus Poribacteria bacterium]
IPPPTVDVPKAIQPPVIDGDLFEKAWSKAVPLQSFYKENGIDPPDELTQGFLMWDEKYLYIGLKAYDSQMRQIQISQTEWDSAVWLDDNLEILIQPSPETPVYYHLIINPIGAVFDQRVQADNPSRDGDVPAYLAAEGLGGEVKWNSHAHVKTQITPIFWSVEVAIPRDALEPASSEEWQFNLRRTVQRTHESSDWSPPDDSEHKETSEVSKTSEVWMEKMSILHLANSDAPETQIGEGLTSIPELDERLEIAGMEVDGNAEIPTPEILQLLPFQRGDIISGHDLSWFNDALEDHSWFRDVRLETANAGFPASTEKQTEEDDKPFVPSHEPEQSGVSPPFKVIVRIHVVELPTRIAETLELRGNERFRADALRESFGLKPGRIALEELATKMQLIATLYKNHGYDLARADYQFVGNNPAPFKLRIDIDEGHLDEIRFSGNHRIRDTTLIKVLGFKPGDAYYQALGELHIQQMRAKLRPKRYFKEVKKWGAKWEGDRRVLAIEIEERSPFKVEPQPLLDFNRVHGLILGGSGEVSTLQAGARTFGAFSIGLASKIWNYQVGAEKAWFERHQLSIGGSLYKRTDTTDDSGLSANEEFLAAVLLGNAFLDYYQREGYQGWVEQRLTPSTGITLEFTNDDHENLFKSTDWSLFNKNDPKRSNLRINVGRLRTFALTYHFDSRDGKSYQKRNFRSFPTPNHLTADGWRGYFSVEYAGSEAGLKGDFDFTRYRFEVVRYNRLSSRHGLDFRLRGGFSDTPLPRQRLFYLGGGGSLRGYDFKAFVGDNILLFNMEYRFHFGPAIQPDKIRANGLTATIFLDTGYTWYDDEKVTLERLNTSIGMGFAFNGGVSTADTLKIEVARALRERHNISLTLRLARMF